MTKCFRNPRKQQFPACFPSFLLRFPVFHMFPLFLRAFPMFPLVLFPVSYFRSYGFLDYSKLTISLHFSVRRHRKFFWSCFISLVKFSYWSKSHVNISSLVLQLWQFSFIRSWTEISKLEIPSPEFCPLSGDWSKLGIPHLAWRSLIKC